jgi:hypothetical protein
MKRDRGKKGKEKETVASSAQSWNLKRWNKEKAEKKRKGESHLLRCQLLHC